MRLATWNCQGGPLLSKMQAAESLAADIAVVPELPRLPVTSRGIWVGDEKKGLAIIPGSGTTLLPAAGLPELPRFVSASLVSGPAQFFLMAVWSKNHGEDRYIRGLHRALDICNDYIVRFPTVIMGDFNSNSIWDHEHPADRNHSAFVQRLERLRLTSAYHTRYREDHGKESQPTFFLYRQEARPFHIDYCFLPESWTSAVSDVTIGSYSEWGLQSDHMPLVVDIDVEMLPRR